MGYLELCGCLTPVFDGITNLIYDFGCFLTFQHVVTASGKVIDEVKDELVCPISMETIRSYAKEVKYSSCEFYSDYNRTPYTPDSDKIICVLKK